MRKLSQPRILAKTLELTLDEWLAERDKGIGGSEIGTIMGDNPYETPVELFCKKLGLAPPTEDKEVMYWGRRTEDMIAREFMDRVNLVVNRRNAIFQHEHEPWMLANIDRNIQNVDCMITDMYGKTHHLKGNGVLECKQVGAYAKKNWTHEVTAYHLEQLQWYIEVMGLQWGAIAVLIGGNEFKWYIYERDDELIDILIAKGKKFWFENILKAVEPELDGSKAATDFLAAKYGAKEFTREESLNLEAPSELYHLPAKIHAAKEKADAANKALDALKNKLKDYMGKQEADVLSFGNLGYVTYKQQAGRKGLDKEKLLAKFPEAYNECVVEGKPFRKFLIDGLK